MAKIGWDCLLLHWQAGGSKASGAILVSTAAAISTEELKGQLHILSYTFPEGNLEKSCES